MSYHVRSDEEKDLRAKIRVIKHKLGIKSISQTIRVCIDNLWLECKAGTSDFITLSKRDYDLVIKTEATKLLNEAIAKMEKEKQE